MIQDVADVRTVATTQVVLAAVASDAGGLDGAESPENEAEKADFEAETPVSRPFLPAAGPPAMDGVEITGDESVIAGDSHVSRDPADYLDLARSAARAFCRRRHHHFANEFDEVYSQALLELCILLPKYDRNRCNDIRKYIVCTICKRLSDWYDTTHGRERYSRREKRNRCEVVSLDAMQVNCGESGDDFSLSRLLADEHSGEGQANIDSEDFIAWLRRRFGGDRSIVDNLVGDKTLVWAGEQMGVVQSQASLVKIKRLNWLREDWESIKDNF